MFKNALKMFKKVSGFTDKAKHKHGSVLSL